MHALVSSLFLISAAAILPFPAPSAGPVTADARFASGQLAQVEPSGKSLIINTGIGPLKLLVEPTSKAFGTDGKPVTLPFGLKPGTYVRVYFTVDKGARLQELDVLPAAMR
jgi:hypothetical protein